MAGRQAPPLQTPGHLRVGVPNRAPACLFGKGARAGVHAVANTRLDEWSGEDDRGTADEASDAGGTGRGPTA